MSIIGQYIYGDAVAIQADDEAASLRAIQDAKADSDAERRTCLPQQDS